MFTVIKRSTISMMRWSKSQTADIDDCQGAVVVNVASREGLLSDLEARLSVRVGFCLATLNLDHVTKLRRMPDFRAAYLRHSHVTADGNPIVWLARLAGQKIDLITGADLIDPIVGIAARCGVSVALFGATQESLQDASRALKQRYPDIVVALTISPPMGFDPKGADADAAIKRLGASGAGLCFIALGAPKQELFAVHANEELPQMGFVSIGAGLDFISGRQARAPKIVRRFAVEWVWRLISNPRRLALRYGACIVILPQLLGTALMSRFQIRRGSVR
jgi:N-acetylglucosaminyldiphosphoundecaprenol N-acetyl-beta-D-mannosaminyltransferase